MLVLPNVTMEPSNVRRKIREPPNVTKVQSYVMLVLHNVRMIPSKGNLAGISQRGILGNS